ncbi:GGDEF domain-containing protein [Pseudobutyrivibrio xylanivorans]|uniref:GGDEF domain-containing protein n=1 Tax=Pseudobutyrivibrio xylanivorans TaxID=185007 RepID=A0A5P6VU54_PSEXY|nr:GGDEF domain-containing protein [Pseudobutyrivibrio xylanivorans]QFJ56117.1 GGDEF domain-containing protein [Pseudobutyrivibrio xylanivorans]
MEELLSKKSPDVAEYIRQINRARKVDNAKHLDLACDLFDMAQERGNEDLKDFASCTLGDACCQNNDFSQALYYLSAGIEGLAKTDEYMLICQSYNEMGIIYRSEGHSITSEECFLSSINIAREHRLYYQEALACSNFAALCEQMGAMAEGLEYHYRAVECCGLIDNSQLKNTFLVGEYALITTLFVMLDKIREAKGTLDDMERLVKLYPEFNESFEICIARWYYYNAVENNERSEECKRACIKAFYDCADLVRYFDEINAFSKLMLYDKEYRELEKVFEHIDNVFVYDDLTNLHLHIEEYKIGMYQDMGDEAKMLEASYNFYEYSRIKAADSKKSFMTTLRLRSELLQQKTKNLFLSAAAETDMLTGLANRTKLNNVIDELFIMANKECKSLGVEMLDVDYFKQVNDNYGHAKGDQLLKTIGKALKEFINDKIFIARYGGDEFVIYYYDMTDDQILEVVREIQNKMDIIGDELDLGVITVSQGIVNRIPEPCNRAWDYLNSADYALYYVKNNGKSNARLIHARKELEQEEWCKVF